MSSSASSSTDTSHREIYYTTHNTYSSLGYVAVRAICIIVTCIPLKFVHSSRGFTLTVFIVCGVYHDGLLWSHCAGFLNGSL